MRLTFRHEFKGADHPDKPRAQQLSVQGMFAMKAAAATQQQARAAEEGGASGSGAGGSGAGASGQLQSPKWRPAPPLPMLPPQPPQQAALPPHGAVAATPAGPEAAGGGQPLVTPAAGVAARSDAQTEAAAALPSGAEARTAVGEGAAAGAALRGQARAVDSPAEGDDAPRGVRRKLSP